MKQFLTLFACMTFVGLAAAQDPKASQPVTSRSDAAPKNNSYGTKLPAFEYAKMIEPELGVPPIVDCGAGVEIPIYINGERFQGDPGIHCCDNPSLQMGDCMSGSSLQRYEGKTRAGKPLPHVVWVSFARHDGRDNVFKTDVGDSVQLIGYSKKTGATAFFESGDNRKWVRVDPKTNRLTGVLPGIDDPQAFNRAYSTPGQTQCVQCHQNDPFIHNPFIDAARLPEDPTQPVVPEIAGPDTPYYVIGASHWDMRTIYIEGNSCLECHRIGMKTIEEFVGDGWKPNEHMPPHDPGSLNEDFEELIDAWKNGPENTANCDWIIPPAGDAPRRVVGEDYPHKAEFNKPDLSALSRLNKKPRTIPEPENYDLAEREHDTSDYQMLKRFGDWAKTAHDRIQEAMEAGKLTKEDALQHWQAFKEKELGPKLRDTVEEGSLSGDSAKEFWGALEKKALFERESEKQSKKSHNFPDTAFEYAKLVEPDLGVPPKVDLSKAVEIPLYVDGVKTLGELRKCDNPTLLGKGVTMSGSMIQRYEGRTADGKPLPDVVWVAFARHATKDFLGSVQMIGYDRKTGATAFFESNDAIGPWVRADPETTRLTGVMPWIDQPEEFSRAYRVPGNVQCVQCHQNEPFITDSFINAAKIPGTDESVVPFLDQDAPYHVIGGENWDMRTIHIEGNSCFECHRVGTSTMELFMSNGWDPNKHMPPHDPGSLAEDLRELLDVWERGPENVDGAEWIIPPAQGRDRKVVGNDYPYKAPFNRPRKPMGGKSDGKASGPKKAE